MENRCVCCGEIIPEGRQVCVRCEIAEGIGDNLISRKAVLDILAEERVRNSILASPAFTELLVQRVKELPKAFDKERVLEELKYCRDFYDINEQPENRFDFRECADIREHKGKWIAYNEAIEIVKKGGIGDEN